MLALAGQPSLHCYYACMVFWIKGALRRTCRQIQSKTSFSPLWVFLLSRNSLERFWGVVVWQLWIGRQDTLGHPLLICFLVVKFSMLVAG